MSVKLAVPDLISPSYFPAVAAVQILQEAGWSVAASLELRFPVTEAVGALRRGEIDVLAGSAHSLFYRAQDGGRVRLLVALSQGTYWFLVVRADLGYDPDTPLAALKGLRIGAAPGPVDALLQMFADAGIKEDEIDVGPIPSMEDRQTSFGVAAAEALEEGRIDGFWANGMGAEIAVRRGTGTVIVDARRKAPRGVSGYTFPALMTTVETWEQRRGAIEEVVSGVIEAQRRLRAEPSLATGVAENWFPPLETSLIALLIERDAPFYDPTISNSVLNDLVGFAHQRGLTHLDFSSDNIVAQGVSSLWPIFYGTP